MATEIAASDADFKLKFDSELAQVDASTLVQVLMAVTTIIEEANRELQTGKTIEVKVKANAPGSFWVHLGLDEVAVSAMMGILNADNFKTATELIKSVAELFNLRKTLKDEEPKEITEQDGRISITNSKNVTVVVDKSVRNLYFNNPSVKDALNQTFETLAQDETIDGFEITDQEERAMFEAAREEFPALVADSKVLPGEKRIFDRNTNLIIIKPSFDKKLKWDLLYQGRRISALVEDSSFLTLINSGASFSKGDALEVDLQVDQTLDKTLNAYVNKTYKVIKVHNHIKRSQTGSLFDTENDAS